jgi:gamma-glutamyltranspeptidase/glutathione hydrolase/leukotriene-C4 hydrolase
VILNLDWGFDLSHAIEEPRVHEQLLPAYVSSESPDPRIGFTRSDPNTQLISAVVCPVELQVSIESGYPPELIEGLKDRGHNVTVHDVNVAMAEVQAVMKSQDDWIYGEIAFDAGV